MDEKKIAEEIVNVDVDDEQGFNDEELEDIMNEIESLEQDFADDDDSEEADFSEALGIVEGSPVNEVDLALEKNKENALQDEIDADINAVASSHSHVDTEAEHLIDEKIQMDASCEDSNSSVVPIGEFHGAGATAGDSCETSMDFAVSGNITLKLNFKVGGQNIKLHVNKKDGFIIEMGGGAKFSIPVGDIKKAS